MSTIVDFPVCPGCGGVISADPERAKFRLDDAALCECGGTAEAPPELMEAARILALAAALPGGHEVVAPESEGLASALWQALLEVYDEYSGAARRDGYDGVRHELAARVYRMIDLG